MKNINFLKLTKILFINTTMFMSIAYANSDIDINSKNHYHNIQDNMNKNNVEDLTIINDSIITQQIRSSISLEPKLHNTDILVTTKKGIVTLTGKISSYKENKLIINIIESIEGVKSINNELKINTKNTGKYIEDAAITTKIKAKLLNDNITSGLHVKVNTINGVVLLQGKVKNLIQLQNAEKIAKNTHGVKKVKNQLIIK